MQNKQSELDMFDVRRDVAFCLLDDDLLEKVEALLRHNAFSRPSVCHLFPSDPEPPKKVLECGCATGNFAKFFLSRGYGWRVLGIDIAPAMVEWNRLHPFENFTSVCGDLEDASAFEPSSFDIVLLPNVLHHFPDCSTVVENVSRWIKPGGMVILFEPNGSSPVSKLSKSVRHLLEKLFGPEKTVKKWGLATVNETDHSMGRYVRLLEESGFSILYKTTLHTTKLRRLRDWIDIRNLLYVACRVFPTPIRGNQLLMAATKKP